MTGAIPARLGVLDWGIGGLDAFRRLRARFPDVAMAYASDSGFTPYGRVPAQELRARVELMARRLGATHLVIACNAASTVLEDGPLGLPTLGVIGPGVAAALATPYARFGLIGGERTIRSGAWERPLSAAGREVVARIAQPLSAHVEAGRLSGPELDRDLDEILAPFKGAAPPEALILACTHYPALADALRRHLPGVALIDPVPALVETAATQWALDDDAPRPRATAPPVDLWTTGSADAMVRAAALAFQFPLADVRERPVHAAPGVGSPG